MNILHANSEHADFIDLCHQLDTHLNTLAGGEENRMNYVPHNKFDSINPVWIAYQQGAPAGCAALKEISPGTAEVKRVFVHPAQRGKGIAKQLMMELEIHAKKSGFQYLVLETGKNFTAAVNLYKKLGYQVIENYGPYVDISSSICMKKEL